MGHKGDQMDEDALSKSGSNTASVYTKPFTVNSKAGTEKSRMQQSMVSKPATDTHG